MASVKVAVRVRPFNQRFFGISEFVEERASVSRAVIVFAMNSTVLSHVPHRKRLLYLPSKIRVTWARE
ncbi:hypothetical protein L9F63_006151, partial [Diploptera punctata]